MTVGKLFQWITFLAIMVLSGDPAVAAMLFGAALYGHLVLFKE